MLWRCTSSPKKIFRVAEPIETPYFTMDSLVAMLRPAILNPSGMFCFITTVFPPICKAVPPEIGAIAVHTLSFGLRNKRRPSVTGTCNMFQRISYLRKASVLEQPASIAFRTTFSPRAFSSARATASSSMARGTARTPSMSAKIKSPGAITLEYSSRQEPQYMSVARACQRKSGRLLRHRIII